MSNTKQLGVEMVFKTLYQNIFKICGFIVLCYPSAQLLPMHRQGRRRVHEEYEAPEVRRLYWRSVLSRYVWFFAGESQEQPWTHPYLRIVLKPEATCPLHTHRADAIKDLVSREFGLTTEQLRIDDRAEIEAYKQALSNDLSAPDAISKELPYFLLEVLSKVLDIVAEEGEAEERDESYSGGTDTSATQVMKLLLDVCGRLSTRLLQQPLFTAVEYRDMCKAFVRKKLGPGFAESPEGATTASMRCMWSAWALPDPSTGPQTPNAALTSAAVGF